MSKLTRRRIIVTALAVAALVVGTLIVARATGIDAAAMLPAHISICGRDWSKDALERKSSLAEIRARDGVEPVVVDVRPFGPCPPGPCTAVAQDGPCDTVIYVRVSEDAYLDYSLQGGP